MLPDFDSVGICKLSRSDSRERARNAVPATTQHLIHQPFPVAGTVGNETIGLSAVQSVARQTVWKCKQHVRKHTLVHVQSAQSVGKRHLVLARALSQPIGRDNALEQDLHFHGDGWCSSIRYPDVRCVFEQHSQGAYTHLLFPPGFAGQCPQKHAATSWLWTHDCRIAWSIRYGLPNRPSALQQSGPDVHPYRLSEYCLYPVSKKCLCRKDGTECQMPFGSGCWYESDKQWF